MICVFVTGIGLTLNNVNYTNNSVVTITDIGTGSAALMCITTYNPCCFSGPPPGTHWYFPNGSRVERFNTLPYYRSRTDASRFTSGRVGRVLLHRNSGATTTGIFRCEILDAIGDFKSIYVGIYTATTGESWYIEEQHVCIERAHGCEHNDMQSLYNSYRGEPEQMLVLNDMVTTSFHTKLLYVSTKCNNFCNLHCFLQ